MNRILDWPRKNPSEALFVVGAVLTVMVILVFFLRPASAKEIGTLADAVLKTMAIAVVGILIPTLGRLTKMSFGGAELEFDRLVNDTNRKEVQIKDLQSKVQHIETGDINELEPLAEMPKLPKPTVSNDTQKGRFGGKSDVDGYRLTAVFPGTLANGRFAKVRVVLEAPGSKATHARSAVFFLDNTFTPNKITAAIENERASFDIIVRGGFTIGTWIVGTKTLLELDLSQLPDAPTVVKYN